MWKITFENWETFFFCLCYSIVSRSLNKANWETFQILQSVANKKVYTSQLNYHCKRRAEGKDNLRFYPLPLFRCKQAGLWSTSTPEGEKEKEWKLQFVIPISLKLLINLRTFRGAWRCRLCNWQHNPLKRAEKSLSLKRD